MTAAQRGALVEQFDKASRIAAAEPVAVVGIGCRFPGGVVGPEEYWAFLAGGGDAITEVPADRWDADAFYDPDPLAPGRMAVEMGRLPLRRRRFDAEFFGITPREAEAMDPQQRLLLEVAWEALEHAGIAPDASAAAGPACSWASTTTSIRPASAAIPDTIDAYSATGNAHSVTVGRSPTCSACAARRRGRHGVLVVAGGGAPGLPEPAAAGERPGARRRRQLILRPETQLALSKWGMLSPRRPVQAFDAGADGFVRGEGAGWWCSSGSPTRCATATGSWP